MTTELQQYQPYDPFERALREAAQQGATVSGLVFLLNLMLSSTPGNERVKESLELGARQWAAQFCYRMGDYFSKGM